MERPIAVIGFSYLAALTVAFTFGELNLPLFAAVLAVAGIISVLFKKIRRNTIIPAVLLTSAVALIMLYGFNTAYVNPTERLEGSKITVTGQICDLPYEQNSRVYYKIETTSPVHTTILVSSKKVLRAELYDTITADVKIYTNNDQSRKSYHISRNTFLKGSLDVYSDISIVHNDNKPFYYYALSMKQNMLEAINNQLPKSEASFVSAIILGDKSSISYEDKEMFRASGISHIIAVSGFHLTVITQIFIFALYYLTGGRKRIASLLCAVFVFLFMAVVGFSPSVVRAGVMQIIYLLAECSLQKSDSFNSLGMAALILCFRNPYSAADVGFLLSFSATFGILLWANKLSRKIFRYLYRRVRRLRKFYIVRKYGIVWKLYPYIKSLSSLTAVSVSALVFTCPITLIYFKTFTPYALLTNILVGLAVSALIFTAFIMVLLRMSMIFRFMELPFIFLTGILLKYIVGVANFISDLPFARVNASEEYIPICIILSLIAIIAVYLITHKEKHKTVKIGVVAVIFIFLLGSVCDIITKQGSMKISVLDVGEGSTVILTYQNETAVISCGGDYDKISSATSYITNSSTEEISYLLILDEKSENSAYAQNLMKNYDIGTVHVYDEEKHYEGIHTLVKNNDHKILSKSTDRSNDTIHWNDVDLLINKTEKCGAVKFSYKGIRFLLCEDGTDCMELPYDWRSCEYLIFNGTLLHPEKITTQNIIISDSESNIDTDLSNIDQNDKNVMSTEGSGDIGIRIYENGLLRLRRETNWQT